MNANIAIASIKALISISANIVLKSMEAIKAALPLKPQNAISHYSYNHQTCQHSYRISPVLQACFYKALLC